MIVGKGGGSGGAVVEEGEEGRVSQQYPISDAGEVNLHNISSMFLLLLLLSLPPPSLPSPHRLCSLHLSYHHDSHHSPFHPFTISSLRLFSFLPRQHHHHFLHHPSPSLYRHLISFLPINTIIIIILFLGVTIITFHHSSSYHHHYHSPSSPS